MAYLPKAKVKKDIKVRVRKGDGQKPHSDYEAYFGVDPFTHQPKRITRASMDDLMAEIEDFYKRHRAGGDAAVRLTAMQALDAWNALDALASAGIKATLSEVATAYIGEQIAKCSPVPEKSVAEAYEEFYDTKPEGADKVKTGATTGKWAEAFGERALSSITAKEVVDYLNAKYGEHRPKTYNSHLLYIKIFLNWCCKDEREYLTKNPIRQVKPKPEPWEEPEYMKPEDVRRLFDLLWAHKDKRPEMLAYAIVNFFCGCRAIEIQRMASDPDAAKIDLADMTVRIAKAKGYQQGKRPRAFHIHPTALAWMKSFGFLDALKRVKKTKKDDTLRDMYELARANGIPVFKNCGRHTFITFHVAAYCDPSKTTAMVGTGEKMRADNYCGLASKADGEAYFAILPPVA